MKLLKATIIVSAILAVTTLILTNRNPMVEKVFEYFDKLDEIYGVEPGSESYILVERGVTFPPGKEPEPISCTHTVIHKRHEL